MRKSQVKTSNEFFLFFNMIYHCHLHHSEWDIKLSERVIRMIFSDSRTDSIFSKKKMLKNTPGTAGGPGGRDRSLAVKSRKNVREIYFFSLKNKIYPKKIFFVAYIF